MNFSKEDWERVMAEPAELVQEEEAPITEPELPEEPEEAFFTAERAPAFVDRDDPDDSVEAEEAEKEVAAKGPMSAFEWMEAAIFALIAIALIFAFVMRTVGVDGDSMNYTLLHGDKLLLSSYPTYIPERGDIVVIYRDNDEPLIKRVIAVEGDTLDIDPHTGEVILNGEVLEEPYLEFEFTPRVQFSGEVVVPDGCIFVVGDNRPSSHDSRYDDIGFVEVSEVMGKALLRVAPLERFGSIYND